MYIYAILLRASINEKSLKLIAIITIIAAGVVTLSGCGSETTGSKVKVIDIQLTHEEYAFGVDKNQPDLLEEVNKFIAQKISDGTFDEILNKYFGDGEPEAVASAELNPSKDQLVVATNAALNPLST